MTRIATAFGAAVIPSSESRSRDALAARLRSVRELFGRSQARMAGELGIPLGSYKDYESAKAMPGGDALMLFFLAGINLNWLLAGQGEQSWLVQRPSQPLNSGALTQIVEGVEAWIMQKQVSIAPDKKAQLIALLYDEWVAKDGLTPQALERYLRLVA